jgi:hypothetical protein
MRLSGVHIVCAVAALAVGCGAGSPSDGDSGAGNDSGTTPDSGSGSDAGGVGDGGVTVHCSGASPSFSSQVHPILEGCGGELCHGGLAQGAWPYDSLVNVHAVRDTCDSSLILVTPGSLQHSYLINKLTGVGMCPNTSTMPLGLLLPQNEIQLIADWICSGAQNN